MSDEKIRLQGIFRDCQKLLTHHQDHVRNGCQDWEAELAGWARLFGCLEDREGQRGYGRALADISAGLSDMRGRMAVAWCRASGVL